MGINIADNFAYNGKKPMDNRTEYATLSAMKSVVDANINEGCLAYNKEDGKYYKFLSTNTVDPTTGKWREFETGGGGQTYNDFTGATSSTAGAHGLVPAPSAGDEGKVLFGSGLWGNLPSVDLSVLSNEAFIFSETEKPVGMWTDRKILYAKTINFGALPDNTSKGVSSGLSNVLIVGMFGITYKSGYAHTLPNPAASSATEEWYYDYSTNDIVILTHEDRSSYTNTYITIFYTKTTDSPLPSDVKFAGVTSAGEVILEKTITGTATGTISDWNEVGNTATLISGIGRVINVVSNGYTSYSEIGYTSQIEAQCNSGQNIYVGQRITSGNIQYNYEIVVYYTLAS